MQVPENPNETYENMYISYTDTWVGAYVPYGETVLRIDTNYDSDEELGKIKEDFKEFYGALTLTDTTNEGERASVEQFDGAKFDCGWHIAKLADAYFHNNSLEITYEKEDVSININFATGDVETLKGDAELVALSDEAGNDIGYAEKDNAEQAGEATYYIRLEDGSYMKVGAYSSDETKDEILDNWERMEEILNSGKAS